MEQIEKSIVFFEQIFKDDNLNPSHISLYIALFQIWSTKRFQNPFRIYRQDVMKLSKIKSIATYHKCISELRDSGFIAYSPSYNSYHGTFVEIIDLNVFYSEKSSNGPMVKKLIDEEHLVFKIPDYHEIKMYFAEKDQSETEAELFYSFYSNNNWTTHKRHPLKSWQSAARTWILQRKKNRDEKY